MPVLITDHPVSQAELLRTFRDKELIPGSFQGVLITIPSHAFPNHQAPPDSVGMFIFHKSLESGVFATATAAEEIAITRENISARAAGEDKTAKDRWAYAVKFNAPFGFVA